MSIVPRKDLIFLGFIGIGHAMMTCMRLFRMAICLPTWCSTSKAVILDIKSLSFLKESLILAYLIRGKK